MSTSTHQLKVDRPLILLIVSPGDGEDTIVDFDLGRDRLGLAGDLEFDDLTF
ncbi:hypothetical protein [Pleurocapsa sp. PCC 7319]|uniref:hypothetical protein n=1 Tax=Pleurocapsa sp. PCC 7319 TaxID=118161 RepID=UPI0003457FF8|nr:hypothetical protein [Pleurocapsa sp. PCC 7319]